jgi:hypothetical protein
LNLVSLTMLENKKIGNQTINPLDHFFSFRVFKHNPQTSLAVILVCASQTCSATDTSTLLQSTLMLHGQYYKTDYSFSLLESHGNLDSGDLSWTTEVTGENDSEDIYLWNDVSQTSGSNTFVASK